MLSKTNAKIELYRTMHSEVLSIFFHQKTICLNYVKHFLSFLHAMTYRHKTELSLQNRLNFLRSLAKQRVNRGERESKPTSFMVFLA